MLFLEEVEKASFSWGQFLKEEAVMLAFGIAQAIIVVIITTYLCRKKILQYQKIGYGLNKAGIEKVRNEKGKITARAKNHLFGYNGHDKPAELKLCFITGVNFFKDYKNDIEKLASNGTKIKILISNPKGLFFSHKHYNNPNILDKKDNVGENIAEEDRKSIAKHYAELYKKPYKKTNGFLEREYLMLSYNKIYKGRDLSDDELEEKLVKLIEESGDHIFQTIYVTKLVDSINNEIKKKNKKNNNNNNIVIHYYDDEYQMPIILAKYNAKDKKNAYTYLWTNINAPIVETSQSINVFCKKDEEDDEMYVDDVEKSFDYLFSKYENTSRKSRKNFK